MINTYGWLHRSSEGRPSRMRRLWELLSLGGRSVPPDGDLNKPILGAHSIVLISVHPCKVLVSLRLQAHMPIPLSLLPASVQSDPQGWESLARVSIFSPIQIVTVPISFQFPRAFSSLDQIYSNKLKMLAFKTIISGIRCKSLLWKWNLHIKYCLKVFQKQTHTYTVAWFMTAPQLNERRSFS